MKKRKHQGHKRRNNKDERAYGKAEQDSKNDSKENRGRAVR